MTDERINEVIRKNNELVFKLQHAEAEIASLKSANNRLEHSLLTLSEKLEDANNEIGRLGMVLKHRVINMQSVQSEKRLGKPNERLLMAAKHH